MADESQAKEPSDDVPADVEVIGLEKIDRSEPLYSMFVAGKAWILSLWKDKTDQIKNITILRKIIGKNDGFIYKVYCTDPALDTMFFAKLQRASMDTVLVHHLLKNMKCGPERFHIVLIKGWLSLAHGVITEEVKDWSMAKSLTCDLTTSLLNEKKRLTTTAFILSILIELGRFGYIPSNRENWGFVEGANPSIPYPHMAVIDFSRGEYARHIFHNRVCFDLCWQNNLRYCFHKWQPVCGEIEDLQLFRDRMSDLRMSLIFGTCIEDEIQHFPFLQSREALLEVLQSACDETALWLHEAIAAAQVGPQEKEDSVSTTALPIDSAHNCIDTAVLQTFRNIPPPSVTSMTCFHEALVSEYTKRVNEWNVSVASLLEWFPFPNGGQTSSSDTEVNPCAC